MALRRWPVRAPAALKWWAAALAVVEATAPRPAPGKREAGVAAIAVVPAAGPSAAALPERQVRCQVARHAQHFVPGPEVLCPGRAPAGRARSTGQARKWR